MTQPLGADAFKFEGHRIIVRDKAQKFPARNAKATSARTSGYLRSRIAVLEQSDFAEKIPAMNVTANLATIRNFRGPLEHDKETIAKKSILQNDVVVFVVHDAR